jgi:hypothetical protein
MDNNQCNDNKFYLHNFKNNKPPTENLKNTINERMQNFMFNPYTFQRSMGVTTPSANGFGASSNYIQDNYQQPNYQQPNYQQPNHQPIDTSSIIFNENRRFNETQMSEKNDDRIMNYSALNRNLAIPGKKYIPFYEHRPVDTTQEYLDDPIEYCNSFNKSDK